MAQKKEIPASVRAQLFAQATRQHIQPMAAQAGAEGSRVDFTLPKTRLLSKIRLAIRGSINVKHDTLTKCNADPFAPYTLIRNVRVEMNNGFSPFNISGKALAMYNMLHDQSLVFDRQESGRGRNVMGTAAANGTGAANTFHFVVDLPIALNERDPVGLILLQNPETVVTVSVEFGNGSAVLAPGQTGFTAQMTNVTVIPSIETFSVPAVEQAFPDLGTLKLVQQGTHTAPGAGEQTVKLPTGTTYRKLILFVENEAGGVQDSFITSDLELVFNQADIPYRVHPEVLAAINQTHYGKALPQGMYVFDFSAFQGLANYGGARDHIDTERLTEFWARFSVAGAATITAVYETLSHLR